MIGELIVICITVIIVAALICNTLKEIKVEKSKRNSISKILNLDEVE